MSEEALDDHLERMSQPPEETVEVEKSYLVYLETENAELKRENEILKGTLIRANRFNELSLIESPPAWDKDSPFQKEVDALLESE